MGAIDVAGRRPAPRPARQKELRLCLVTSFFGARSFGGDAVFVERLAGALARRGHEVHVAHCADAFETVRTDEPLRAYRPPDGVTVHTFRSGLRSLQPLITHQTGRAGPNGARLRRLVGGGFDAVHFHNVSLLGGLQLLRERSWTGDAARLLSAHDYWLVCPTSVLWKLDREPCEDRSCLRCTLHARRPPQLWRSPSRTGAALSGIDALIVPSRASLEHHASRGVDREMVALPYFLPDGWAARRNGHEPPPRPYFLAVGRLVRLKGFDRLIRMMRELPEADLLVAGAGPQEAELRQAAEGLPNVRLLGLVAEDELRRLYADARAVVIPSLAWETFCYVALEAFAHGTPTIVRERGALPEVARASGGGIVCRDDSEMLAAMRGLVTDDGLRDRLGAAGRASVEATYSEEAHVQRYLGLIAEIRGRG